MNYLIKGGIVYDPMNNIDGEALDLSVSDGKIVESVDESNAKVIDASHKLVMAGGVDLHSHIAGPKVNAGRLLRPEDHLRHLESKQGVRRAGAGYSIPSVFSTGYRYALMGYTTVFEPATPPLKTVHTHHELNDIPLVDKGCLPLLGNNWIIMEHLEKDNIEACTAFVAWLLTRIKGYGIKLVNPGGIEAWKWGGNVTGLDDMVPRFDITPRQIIRGLCKVQQMLNIPHPIHVHCNLIGCPGNYRTTLKTMDSVRDLAKDGQPIMHLTHVQFHAYGGKDWASVSSRAEEIAKYVNGHPHITIDTGQVIFTETTTMTADGPFEYQLQQLTGNRWMNTDVEVETGSGIVPIRYMRNNYAHAVMWAIGLELALLVKDLWRVIMTTDHPNGGPFTFYPRVMSWLMSKKAREKIIRKIPRMSRIRTDLKSIDREYSFYDLAIVTRAAPAKLLGLKDKGGLGIGADADISIYDIDPKEIDPSEEYIKVRRAFAKAAYTFKEGKIVVKDGEIVESLAGKTFWMNPEVPEHIKTEMYPELQKEFEELYTVRIKNYHVPERFLTRSCMMPVSTKM